MKLSQYHLDEEVLNQLKSLDPTGALTKELFQLFLGAVPVDIQELYKAVELRECDRIKKVAHSLKSTCQNIGMMAMTQLCVALENNPKDFDQALSNVRELDKIYAAIHGELSQYAKT